MRLELRPQTRTENRQTRWVLEYGRRTVGRSRDCDWQIEDDSRRVSKLHCTIAREGKGFVLSDQSANGTLVDGKQLMEGESSTLRDGSVIDVRGHRFTVSIVGGDEQDLHDPVHSLPLSDENLTISSILSDIAPNGKTARGIMGERLAEEPWAQPPASSSSKSGKTLTRNVDIGWSGPPQVDGSTPVLPDNWFEDEDYGSQLEHRNATRTVVTVAPPKRQPEAVIVSEHPSTSAPRSDFDDVFAEPSAKAPAPAAAPDALLLTTITKALTRLDTATADCFAALGMDVEPPARPVLDTADLINQLEALVQRQTQLGEVLERMMREATQKLDPRLLEARVDADQPRLPFWRGRDYWSAYRQQFEQDGRMLTIKDFMRRAASGEAEQFKGPEFIKRVDTQDEA